MTEPGKCVEGLGDSDPLVQDIVLHQISSKQFLHNSWCKRGFQVQWSWIEEKTTGPKRQEEVNWSQKDIGWDKGPYNEADNCNCLEKEDKCERAFPLSNFYKKSEALSKDLYTQQVATTIDYSRVLVEAEP